MVEIHVNMKQLNKWKVYSDNVIAYDQIIQSKGKFFTVRPEIYTRWLDEYGIFYTLKGAEKEIRKANPAPRKRAAKKSGAEADYVAFASTVKKRAISRPSQITKKAPTKRLVARRKVAAKKPVKGYFPNPAKKPAPYSALPYCVQLEYEGRGWKTVAAFAAQIPAENHAHGIAKKFPDGPSIRVIKK